MPRKPTKIKSYHVMPEILEFLQHEKLVKTAAINKRMRSVAKAKGLPYRPQASYALTVLKWKGWASNDAHGFWAITNEGSACPRLTEARAIEIVKEWEARKENTASARRVVFARVGWMKYYNGSQSDDQQPLGGGSYNKIGRGSEICNFKVIHGTRLYGFFEAPGRDSEGRGVTNLGRIAPGVSDDRLDDVLVIFLAPDASAEDPSNRLKMVGWYQNAKVLRFWQDDPTGQRWTLGPDGEDEKALYNVTARVEDAVLLPTHRRTQSIPRGKNGIGQANVRYVYDDQEILAMASWMKDVLEYIDSYNGENLLADPLAEVEQIAEGELEKAAGFESNPKIRRAIEAHAMDVVKQDYRRNRFVVTDKHAYESYDLLCEKDGFQVALR